MTETTIEQNGSKSSTNIQNNDLSKNIVVINQPNYLEIKQIALDVYKQEAHHYSEEAAEKALKKVEELVENFLTKLYDINSNKAEELKKPSVQHSLFNAQKGYVLDETNDTQENYIDLLLSRVQFPNKSMLQISVDEAIKTIEKLTPDQMDCLTFMFLTYNNIESIVSLGQLNSYCNNLCSIFHESFLNKFLPTYLKSINVCLSLDNTGYFIPLQELFFKSKPGLFFKGFDLLEFLNYLGKSEDEILKYNSIIVKDLRDPEKYQINAINLETLKVQIKKYNLEEDSDKITSFFQNHIMSIQEIENDLLERNIKMRNVLDIWKNNKIKYCELTPTGIIIAISNYNRKFGDKLNYSDYIK